eukprot:scaffold68758_cov52-Attheya_sp.AAC.5
MASEELPCDDRNLQHPATSAEICQTAYIIGKDDISDAIMHNNSGKQVHIYSCHIHVKENYKVQHLLWKALLPSEDASDKND